MKRTWILGTRGSKLALRQTEIVMGRLKALYPEDRFMHKIIKTTVTRSGTSPSISSGARVFS